MIILDQHALVDAKKILNMCGALHCNPSSMSCTVEEDTPGFEDFFIFADAVPEIRRVKQSGEAPAVPPKKLPEREE